ncbi:MAG: hypothetical protein OXI01_23365 [Albidovulum sp.]|nr:hypothetical protein [Albidovulum sp.]
MFRAKWQGYRDLVPVFHAIDNLNCGVSFTNMAQDNDRKARSESKMPNLKIVKFECDYRRAIVTFAIDEQVHSQAVCVVEGRHLADRKYWTKNRSSIEKKAVLIWLNKNWDNLSKETIDEIEKFAK